MDAEHGNIAKICMDGAHDGSLSFPDIVAKLIDAGFEGYAVDYRRNTQIFYLPDGDSIQFEMADHPGTVGAAFNAPDVAAQVRWAQAEGEDYSYAAFSENVKAAGCAGYFVSFLGRRVRYFGRTAETHVEMFPR